MPFSIHCSSSSGVPFYKQIINQIIIGVSQGILKPGTQLPTVRQLAVELSINLNTVARAYKELEIRGIVSTQQGTGTFVTGRLDDITARDREVQLRQHCEHFLARIASIGITLEEGMTTLKKMEGELQGRTPERDT